MSPRVVAVKVVRNGQVLDITFNIDPTRFADRMDIGCERKKNVEHDSKVLA